MSFISLSWIINRGFYALLVILLLWKFPDAVLVSICWFLGAAVGAFYLLRLFWRQFGGFRLVFDWHQWKDILHVSIPMAMAYFMTQIYYNFDTIMLKIFKGDEVVGLYNAAYKIIFLLIVD